MRNYDVLIIGAGASGLVCAAQCARRGRKTAILEHADTAGRKLRVTGGGRCNFTNLEASAADYVCGNPHFVKSALARYTPWDILAFLDEHGISHTDEGQGMLFAESADKLTEALVGDAADAGVGFYFNTRVVTARRHGERYVVETSQGEFAAESLVVASGGLAWPQVGATGVGYELAQKFGLRVTPRKPGLAPLPAQGGKDGFLDFCRALSGNALPVRLELEGAPPIAANLLFTHKGVSGPAALDASLFWQPGKTIHIDFLPGVNVAETLLKRPKLEVKNALAQLVSKRMAALLCERHNWSGAVASWPQKRLQAVETLLHAYPFIPAGVAGYAKAEVTLGGVDVSAVSSKTMEVQENPGLFFTGEALDVTGRLGGYNLQWAWASGFAAGRFA